MAWEEEEVEQEYGEEMAAPEDEVVVGQMLTVMVPKHIKKCSLKNKTLSVTLDTKALRDFVTGFHKRKKKRIKEVWKILQDKERKKRIHDRKRRKEEKEIALYGRVLSSDNADGDVLENEGIGNDGEMETTDDLSASLSEIKTYEDDGTRITVTTREITHEGDYLGPKTVGPRLPSYTNKNPSLPAKKNSSLGVKKKPQKRMFKNKSKAKKKATRSGMLQRVKGRTKESVFCHSPVENRMPDWL